MDPLEVCLIIEGDTGREVSMEEYIDACQYAINHDWPATMPGRIGRACQDMIDRGHCHPKKGIMDV